MTVKQDFKNFKFIFDTVEDLIFLLRKEQNSYFFEEVNKSYLKATGFEYKTLIGKRLDEVLSEKVFANVIRTYEDISHHENPLRLEEIWYDVPQKNLHVDVQLIPVLNKKGKLTHVIGSARDITEKKLREKKLKEIEISYKDLFDSVSEAIYLHDKNGVFKDVNTGAVQMYGYNKEDFIGKTPAFLSAKGKNDLKIVNSYIKKAFNGETQIFTFWGRRKNGQVFPKEVILNRGLYRGKPVIIAAARDISERYENENKLKRYAEELQETNRSKDKIFSLLAHDLRSPFNGILGFSKVLFDEAEDLSREEIREYIGYVYTASKNVYNLIENLLNWSKIQTGRIQFQPIRLDLYEEIFKVINLYTTMAIEKKIKIINIVPVNSFIYIDQNLLNSLLQNLISNSIKFTGTGGKVVISYNQKSDYTEITVEDNGIGISEDNLSKLFKIEAQFSTSGTNNEQGSGLGLVLCKELLTKINGYLNVNSELNKGTIFTFGFPNSL
jgi:PAS domain S-box-containing protein